MSLSDKEIIIEEELDELALLIEENNPTPRLNTQELLEVFPEITDIAKEKIEELQHEIMVINLFNKQNKPRGNELEKIWEEERRENEYKELKRQLMRFKRFIPQSLSENEVSEAQIEQAKEFPILDLVDNPRRAGRDYITLCPLHQEKTPSCHIYIKSNKFWCFGCNRGGDTIDLVMAMDKVDFTEAVKRLI